MTGPIIALIMFWRKRVKRLTTMEILEKKRQMLEDNLEYMDSDDDSHDMSKSRASNMMDESMRDSSLRGTGIFKQNSNYYDKDSNSDFFGKSK